MLNDVLYEKLCAVFGEDKVRVSNQGVPVQYVLTTYHDNQGNVRTQPRVLRWGETYKVCCPFCGDTRFRLCFCHAAGTFFTKNRKKLYFGKLVKCFNEECQRTDEFQKLWKKLQRGGLGRMTKAKIGDPQYVEEASAENDVKVDWPIGVLPPTRTNVPGEIAEYWIRRRLPLDWLYHQFGVMYAPVGVQYTDAERINTYVVSVPRVVIPIRYGHRIVEWQMRACSDQLPKHEPKYLSRPGGQIHNHWYQADQAWDRHNIVICEGVTDVWRIGVMPSLDLAAVASFGKVLSPAQIEIAELLFGYSAFGIILADPDVDKSELQNNVEKLEASEAFPDGLVVVQHKSRDPAAMTRRDLYEMLRDVLNRCRRLPTDTDSIQVEQDQTERYELWAYST